MKFKTDDTIFPKEHFHRHKKCKVINANSNGYLMQFYYQESPSEVRNSIEYIENNYIKILKYDTKLGKIFYK